MSLFRILFLGLLGYFLFKAVRNLLGLGFSKQKVYSNSQRGTEQKTTYQYKKPERKKPEKHVQGGEYIDFEEVE